MATKIQLAIFVFVSTKTQLAIYVSLDLQIIKIYLIRGISTRQQKRKRRRAIKGGRRSFFFMYIKIPFRGISMYNICIVFGSRALCIVFGNLWKRLYLLVFQKIGVRVLYVNRFAFCT